MNYEPSTMNQKGFTFVELMIVLVIIGILLTLAYPGFTHSVQKAREATLKEDLFIFREAIDHYYTDQGQYPPALQALVEKRYLRKIPVDPITGSDATWVLVYATNEAGEQEGIFDIKSGSEQLALDGSKYQDW